MYVCTVYIYLHTVYSYMITYNIYMYICTFLYHDFTTKTNTSVPMARLIESSFKSPRCRQWHLDWSQGQRQGPGVVASCVPTGFPYNKSTVLSYNPQRWYFWVDVCFVACPWLFLQSWGLIREYAIGIMWVLPSTNLLQKSGLKLGICRVGYSPVIVPISFEKLVIPKIRVFPKIPSQFTSG